MKIIWLSAFPENLLQPELITVRNRKTHSTSWVINLAKTLAIRPDIELHIITSSANIKHTQSLAKWGIHFHVIKYSFPFMQRGFPSFFPYDSITWYKNFRNEAKHKIEVINPDLIHAHGIEKGFALAALDSDFKSVVSIQGIFTRMQIIDPTLKGFFQKPIEKYTIKRHRNFGCRTDWDKEFVLKLNPNANVLYMPEMINDVFFEKTWYPITSNTIVFVGSIIGRKGVDDLIDALSVIKKSIPDIILKLIGSGPKKYIEKIKVKITNLSLESNVLFLGTKNSDEIASILEPASIFVLPTYIDNSPNSLAEAMAVGMPCIASNVGGIPSMINHNENGILFKVGDVEALALAVINIFHDPSNATRLAYEAKKSAYKSNFKDNVVEQTIKVYKELIGNQDEKRLNELQKNNV